jgi:5'-nucleotidase
MRPLILLTNDDGIHSPGLHAAAEAVAHLGDLLISAPRHQQTAMSRSMPSEADTGIIEMLTLELNGAPHPVYAVHGSPAQAVLHAVLELAPRLPDLCISGINYGENLGTGVTMSGTVGAAIQATIHGIPALAVSTEADVSIHHMEPYVHIAWDTARHFTVQLAEMILRRGLPPQTSFLNVNVPVSATPETPMRMTTQSLQRYFVTFKGDMAEPRDFSSRHRFSYGIQIDKDALEPTSDIYAFAVDRVVSVTPMNVDLTAKGSVNGWLNEG